MGRKRHLLRRRRPSLSLAENHSSRSLLLGRSGTTCCCRRIGMDDAPPIWAINETNGGVHLYTSDLGTTFKN